jgi:hypothetical protein
VANNAKFAIREAELLLDCGSLDVGRAAGCGGCAGPRRLFTIVHWPELRKPQ